MVIDSHTLLFVGEKLISKYLLKIFRVVALRNKTMGFPLEREGCGCWRYGGTKEMAPNCCTTPPQVSVDV